jgi:SWI/SNF-related matrix-associated actin-dependent regulator of chromatin subfamily A3
VLQMGLGKTITCVSLIATTLNSAQAFAAEPLPPPIPPPAVANESSLDADHFKNAVWGLPTTSGRVTKSHLTAKEQAKLKRESEAAADVYTRACRLKVKSRATLIVCPLSTISNWEDQFREHWAGQVTVVGGGGGVPPTPGAPAAGTSVTPSPGTPASALCSMGPLTASLLATESRGHALPSMPNLAPPRNDVLPAMPNVSAAHAQAVPTPFLNGQGPRPCRIYVYHGNSRRPDPLFLADFDAVITTFSTLATEFSRQCKSNTCEDDDDSIMEIDEHGNTFGKPKKGVKRKKGITAACDVASPLQSVCWFRVVLDEAQYVCLLASSVGLLTEYYLLSAPSRRQGPSPVGPVVTSRRIAGYASLGRRCRISSTISSPSSSSSASSPSSTKPFGQSISAHQSSSGSRLASHACRRS